MSGFPLPFGGGDADALPTLITDHAQRAKDRLAQQYKNQPNLAAILDAFNAQTQELEGVLYDLFTLRGIGGASGVQLDVLGAIVGQPRNGLSDDDYRLWIQVKIALNKSGGTTPETLAIFAGVNPGAALVFRDEWPAAFTLVIDDYVLTDTAAAVMVALLGKARGGGVRAILEWRESLAESVFTMDGAAGQALDVGKFAGAAVAL